MQVHNISELRKLYLKNPNLIIILDNSLAPFIKDSEQIGTGSLENRLSKNIISIFSFSDYFGIPGYKLSLIAMAASHITNHLVDKRESHRYKHLCPSPEKLSFIDCVALESQKLGTNGMSGIQQAIMCITTLGEMIDKDKYGNQVRELLQRRREILRAACNYALPPSDTTSTNYYAVLNIPEIALRESNDKGLNRYIQSSDPIEFIKFLAENYNIVVMPYIALAGHPWCIRVTIANINDDEAKYIGESILHLISTKYTKRYSKDKKIESIK